MYFNLIKMALFNEDNFFEHVDEDAEDEDQEEALDLVEEGGKRKSEAPAKFLVGSERVGERYVTKFQRTKIISLRAKQIQDGAVINPLIYLEVLVSQLLVETDQEEGVIREFFKGYQPKNYKEARDKFTSIYPAVSSEIYIEKRKNGVYSPDIIARMEFDARVLSFTTKNYNGTYETWHLNEMI